eukprot:6208832-Pleurochrysis_carterae.AAC.1
MTSFTPTRDHRQKQPEKENEQVQVLRWAEQHAFGCSMRSYVLFFVVPRWRARPVAARAGTGSGHSKMAWPTVTCAVYGTSELF